MTDIDFLPTRYHEQTEKRRNRLWQVFLMAMFGAVIAATAVVQQSFHTSAARQLNDVTTKHSAALALKAKHDKLQSELKAANDAANLFAYLRHPWPRTQVLLALRESLPQAITLTNINIGRDADRSREVDRRARRDRRRDERQDQPTAAGSPAEMDLQLLRQEGKSPVVVHVTGQTTSPIALHGYLANLKAARMFAKADLVSLESLAGWQSGKSQFALKLTLLPGYGQAGGSLQPVGDPQQLAAGGDR